MAGAIEMVAGAVGERIETGEGPHLSIVLEADEADFLTDEQFTAFGEEGGLAEAAQSLP